MSVKEPRIGAMTVSQQGWIQPNGIAAPFVPYAFNPNFLVLSYGQSLSVGLTGTPALTTAADNPADLMLNTGLRQLAIEGGTISSTVPLAEKTTGSYGETGTVACVNKAREYAPTELADLAVFGIAAGRGGSDLEHLSKGMPYYTGMLTLVNGAMGLLPDLGLGASIFTHGEADQVSGTSQEAYRVGFEAMYNDILSDVPVAAAGWKPVILWCQTNSHLRYAFTQGGPTRPNVALAQRDLTDPSRNRFCALSKYHLDYSDNVHMTNESYKQMGLQYGRALGKVLKARQSNTAVPALAVDLISATWSNRSVLMKFSVPHGILQFDTDLVADTWNKGFDLWTPDYQLIDTIKSVGIAGPDTVRIVFSENVPTGSRLTYAFGRPGLQTTSGRLTGPRGNLRDQEGDVDNYVDGSAATRYLHNWCLLFETIKN